MAPIRTLITADLHFEEKYLPYTARAWKDTLDWACQNQVDRILIAGDVFTDYNLAGRTASMGTIYDAFARPLLDAKIQTVIVVGNHDLAGVGQKDALVPLDGNPIVDVRRMVEVFPAKDIMGQDPLMIAALPWLDKAQMLSNEEYRGLSTADAEAAFYKNIDLALGHLRRGTEAAHDAGVPVILLGHCTVVGSVTAKGFGLGGGSFCLTDAQLESVGADVIAIGDIHRRQGHYVGALIQNGYGEEGNPVGFRTVVFDGRKVVEDRYVDVQCPKYFTVTPETYPPLGARDGDKIKVRGQVRPEGDLPENVTFERIPVPVVVQARTSETLTSDMPVETLLGAWMKVNACPVAYDDLVVALRQVVQAVKLPTEAIGSLSRIDRLRVEGIGHHARTEVDLSDLQGVIAVVGDNGTGKTFLLESPMAIAYGQFPYRPCNLRDCMGPGATDALMEWEFWRGDYRWRMVRQMKKSASGKSYKATGYIYQWEGVTRTWDPKAGPAIEAVEMVAEELIGDPDLVKASVFCSQNQAGDLADASPAERKELFAKLLGTARLAVVAEGAKKVHERTSAEMQALKSRIAALDFSCGNQTRAEEELRDTEADVRKVEAAIAGLQAELSPLREEEARLKAHGADRARLEERLRLMRADVSRLSGQISDAQARAEAHRQALGKRAQFEEAERLAVEKEARLDALRQQSQTVQEARQGIQKQIDARREKVADLRVKVTVALNKARQDKVTEARKLEDEARAIEQAARETVLKLRSGLEASIQRVEALRRRANLLTTGTFDAPTCKTCPFTKDAFAAREELIEAELRMEKDKQAHQEAVQAPLDPRLTHLKTAANVLVEQSRVLQAQDVCPELCAEGKQANEEIAVLDKQMAGLVVDPSAESALAGEIKLHRQLAAMLHTLPTHDRELANIEQFVAEVAESLRVAQAGAEEAAADLAKVGDNGQALAGVRATILDRDQMLRIQQSRRNSLAEVRGQRAARLASIQDDVARREKLRTELQASESSVILYQTLQQAFSRDGIPQLVVSSAIPQFQEVLTDLLKQFDGRWAVLVDTQSETQKGAIREVLDILVDDGDGPRDILTYSGGERKLLKTLIRIAFAVLQAQRSGGRLQVFWLDEAFDALDGENARRILSVFSQLGRWFEQIFVVSHSPALVASIPNRIVLTTGANGTVAQVQRG